MAAKILPGPGGGGSVDKISFCLFAVASEVEDSVVSVVEDSVVSVVEDSVVSVVEDSVVYVVEDSVLSVVKDSVVSVVEDSVVSVVEDSAVSADSVVSVPVDVSPVVLVVSFVVFVDVDVDGGPDSVISLALSLTVGLAGYSGGYIIIKSLNNSGKMLLNFRFQSWASWAVGMSVKIKATTRHALVFFCSNTQYLSGIIKLSIKSS